VKNWEFFGIKKTLFLWVSLIFVGCNPTKVDSNFDPGNNLNPVAIDSAPSSINISPSSFLENIQSVITLSYTDNENDLASSCAISNLVNVTETQVCACSAGVCTVGVTSAASGAASFDYTVTANGLVSNTATATLSVVLSNNAPVANNFSPAVFNEDIQSVITLSYTDANGDLATSCALSSLTNVTVTQACACAAGVCTVGVTGTNNYNGAGSFNFTVVANAQTSNSAVATLSISAVNDAPTISNVTDQTTNEDTATSAIAFTISDVESTLACNTAVTGTSSNTSIVANAAIVIAGIAPNCIATITPVANATGTSTITLTVSDGTTTTNDTFVLTVTAVNDAPVASNLIPSSFNEDTVSTITLVYNDTENDLASTCTISNLTNVTVSSACSCTLGTCTVGVTGTSNYNGAASFDYTVTANTQTSNTASATLTIDAIDDAPVAANISPAAFNEDTQSVITLSYTDAESHQATTCATSSLSNVTVTQACACAAGVCTVGVTGTSNYNGAASFDYTVTANGLTSTAKTATLSITAVNDAPAISNVTDQTTNEDTATSAIAFTISDAESTLVCSTAVSGTSSNTSVVDNASIVIAGTAPNCTATITPVANAYGVSTITLTVTDGTLTANDTFVLTVTQLYDDLVNGEWTFDEGSDSDYTFDNSKIELIDGMARLINLYIDKSSAATNFGAGSTHTGTVWDGSKLALDTSGTPVNNSSLDSSWMPKSGNLIHYMKFDSNFNDSVGGLAGSATNSVRSTAAAKIGTYGISQDGDGDYINYTKTFTTTPRSESISAWFQSRGNSQGAIIPSVFAILDTGNEQLGAMASNNTQSNISCRSAGDPTIVNSGSISIQRNTWYQVVCTTSYSGNTMTLSLYLNGQFISSGSGTVNAYDAASTRFRIGNQKTGNNRSWNGYIDDVAYWNTTLDATDVKQLYDRQKARYTGIFESKIINGGAARNWNIVGWKTTLPSFKELPDNGVNNSEQTSRYSSLFDSNLLTDLKALWHFNGTVGVLADSDVLVDDSGNSHSAVAVDTDASNTIQYINSHFYQGIKFDGTNDYVSVADHDDFHSSTMTVAGWVSANPVANSGIIGQWDAGVNKRSWMMMTDGATTGKLRVLISDDGTYTSHVKDYVSSLTVLDNSFHHVAFTFNSGTLKLYVDGVEDTSVTKTADDSITTVFNSDIPLIMGANLISGAAQYFLKGTLDEFAFWDRVLDPAEITQLYRRGASRVKVQVKTCNDSACSGETWVGSNNDAFTYFSELNNNSIPNGGTGNVQKNWMTYLKMSDFGITLTNNQYFQYRVILETDSTSAGHGPELTAFHYGPNYNSSSPAIVYDDPVNFVSFDSIAGTLGNDGCTGTVTYQISRDKTNWFYYNSGWVTATAGQDLVAESNTSNVINSNSATFPAASGDFYIKAFLNSSGILPCDLDKLIGNGYK
jgi:hypothetical protein